MEKACFSQVNASSTAWFQTSLLGAFFRSTVCGPVIDQTESCDEVMLRPQNLCISIIDVGVGQALTAATPSKSMATHLELIM